MGTDRTRDEWLALVRPFEHDGEFFRAYDLAQQGLQHYPGDAALAHRAVLNLCNAGALPMARRKFAEYGLEDSNEIDHLALGGRLLKSEAFGLQGERQAGLLRAAAAQYGRAYARARAAGQPDAYYPGVTLAIFILQVR